MTDAPKTPPPRVCRRCGKPLESPAPVRCPHCGFLLPLAPPKETGK